jgi:putative ABC transport system permease protein
MFRNYFKIALRHLKKNKGYAFINMIGLSLGMACAILILLWVNDELHYNSFNKNYSRLYQVMESQSYDGKTYTFSAMPGPFVNAIKQDIPEIKYAARTDWGTRKLFTLGEKSIYEQGLYTDPDFLKMFSYKIIHGDPKALLDPKSIFISDKMAEKFYGRENPIGKTLRLDDTALATVAGVFVEPDTRSTLQFSWLAAFETYANENKWLLNWGNNGIQNYVQLNDNADVAAVNRKFSNFIQSKDTTAVAKPFLFAMNDWRLRNKFIDGVQSGGRIQYVNLFSIIALLIILIACINFMNLATARSEQRAREVGVRKAMGAGRGMLIRQFFGESIVMSFAAMVLALVIVIAILPAFNTLVDKKLAVDFSSPAIWAELPAIAILCGVLSGSYPSLYLSSFNPTTVFKGLKTRRDSVIAYVRKGLVITQFVVSIMLIISTIIIYKQIQHVKERQLGYNKDNIVITGLKGKMNEHFQAMYQQLMATGAVENAAVSNSRVLELNSSSGDFNWPGKDPNAKVLVSTEWVSPAYVSTMKMQIKYGRDFYKDGVSDTSNVIVNETFAKIIGKENPVGEVLTRDDNSKLQIVGVVKDFVFNDMYKAPDPAVLICQPSSVNRMLVRLKSNKDVSASLAKIEAVIKDFAPGYPFEYKFMDDEFANLFKSEMLIGKLSRLFAFLTILISCLGLFGLAAYMAERRTKEIGIRKVLGATIVNVITLLSKDFLRLVAIASLIAFPLAWFAMHKWLEDFAYRINIPFWVFAAAGILSVIIALCTVSFQAIKAAVANPVSSLRTE